MTPYQSGRVLGSDGEEIQVTVLPPGFQLTGFKTDLRTAMRQVLAIMLACGLLEWMYVLLLKPADPVFANAGRTTLITLLVTAVYIARVAVRVKRHMAAEAGRNPDSVVKLSGRLQRRFGVAGRYRFERYLMAGAAITALLFYCVGSLAYQLPQFVLLYSESMIFMAAFAVRNALITRRARSDRTYPFALYLRSFSSDGKTSASRLASLLNTLQPALQALTAIETSLYGVVRHCAGSSVAVGQPGVHFPRFGFPRLHFPEDRWRAEVTGLMAAADVILMEVHFTDWVLWEMDRIAELDLSHKTILLFFPDTPNHIARKISTLAGRLGQYAGLAGIPQPEQLDLVCAYRLAGEPLHCIYGPPYDRTSHARALTMAMHARLFAAATDAQGAPSG